MPESPQSVQCRVHLAGPVLEATVDNVADAKQRLVKNGCQVVKDEPAFPRCYLKDPFGLISTSQAKLQCTASVCVDILKTR